MSGSPNEHGLETIVNEIIALNTGAQRPQPDIGGEARETRSDNTHPLAQTRQISDTAASEAREIRTENKGSLVCLRQIVNRYPAVTPPTGQDPSAGQIAVTAEVHGAVQRDTIPHPPVVEPRDTAPAIPGPSRCFGKVILPRQVFPDGSVGVVFKRQESPSTSRRAGQHVPATVKVQPRGQKKTIRRELWVIPGPPERKRQRQSGEEPTIWNENFVQAWDKCDMNQVSSVEQEPKLNQPPEISEIAVNPDVDADNLPSNQEEYKNQVQNDVNKEILNSLNTVVKNQKRIIEDHQKAQKEQARFNQTQIGEGLGNQPHRTLDLTDPNMGLTQDEIESLVREGGDVAGYSVIPRARFNGLEIHRIINLREISSTNLADYTVFLHDTLSEIVAFSRLLGGDGSLINITLRGASLTSDVNTLLSQGNDYSVDLFTDQLEKIMQSNSGVQFDESLNLRVSIARSKNGGARRKIRDLAHDEVIRKNSLHLFIPMNISSNLCFAICLAHFLNPQKPHTELESVASSLQKAVGYTDQHKVALNDITLFERMLNIKIVVFYRSNTGELEKYTNTDVPHHKTVFLYLHDNHYFMIKNLHAFIGTSYTCAYCYAGFNSRRDHRCRYTCDVCNAPECHLYPKKTKHCVDCLRYCRSDYCFEMHKKPPPGHQFAQCDVTKYCRKCNRRYHVSGTKPKPHKCPADQCPHCGEGLVADGVHQCFIQPVKMKKPDTKYIYFDFETRYENGKHVANFVCAITYAGEEFVAEGPDCVQRLIKKFRRPRYRNFTWIAHNASGFDNFILLEYFTRMGIAPKITMQGCRLIFMYDDAFKQRFIDSYSFIPMRLANTPAAFNLPNAEKGYFPHHFNRIENDSYVGPYPAKDFYGYATMSNKDRAEFDEWRQFDDKLEILKHAYGLHTEVQWECSWTRAKQSDANVIAFMSTYKHPERLNPRDALFGGRTNAFKLYHKAAEGEVIRYVDYTSLYPFCQATKCYPIGHPQIIFKDFGNLENYYGLIKATVLPPRKLLHPTLPVRLSGKLLFPLCRSCAEQHNQTLPCMHTDEERAIHGCWVSIELLKAIEKGYVVVKVDEVWHFPQRSETLFCDYVKTFLQFKQESSGFPKDVVTDADKESYVRDYFEKEGINLNMDKIELNPARRSIMKLILNSLWGRFCLREGLPTTEIVKDPEEFARHIFGTEHEIRFFSFVSDTVAIVQWSYANGKAAPTRDVNVFLGAFTTAHARLELYDVMERLGDRLLYCDTDSLIYTAKDGEYEPPLGPYLGDLTDEVGPGDHITLFSSAGPKSYGYVTAKGKVCMKVKGITLNAVNSEVITLDSLIGLVDHYVTERDNSLHVLAHNDTIVRNKKNLTLHNKSFVKKFKVVYDKRVLLPDFTTLPYGF
ncbi:putative DNA polymerase [Labeo rohita]|uniref:DNA-directed DNA polymerase n=1 Tax=Labeo rohita TaxID=84645 RepID=A0ABQ8L418_LABRO|nr:putative DNA polymerase [Labeo rohita]